MNYLDGDVTFLAVPSEEFIDTDYRNNLKKCKKITYFSGKQEMIKLGIFNNTDAAIMVHSQANCPERQLFIGGGGLGFTQSQSDLSAERHTPAELRLRGLTP